MVIPEDFRLLAVIPAYNEARTIAAVIKKTKRYVRDVVVVDDGSSDDTAAVSEKAGAGVIRHVLNKGYGAAQRTGHQYAIRHGYDYMVQLDGDGQHRPEYIPKMLEMALTGKYDLVIGSRFLTKSYRDYSLVRKSGISFFTGLVNMISGMKITDATSGFKLFRVEKLKGLSRSSDLHPAVEQMLEMHKKRFRIKEIPMVMPVRAVGQSHLSLKRFFMYPWRAFTNALKVIIYKY